MRGDVRVRVECLLPEQLIKRAIAEGARLRGVRRLGPRTLVIDTDPAGARRLIRLCRRFSIPAAVVRRSGASAAVEYAKRRATLLPGIALCVALCALFLGRVWQIDIAFTGDAADRGETAPLMDALNDLGVRPGVPRPANGEWISQALQARAGDYSFVGVRAQGVRLLVEAAPELPAPTVYDVDAARDLVARQDGIVVSANVRSGALCVKPGDTVRRGQLLIRGEEKRSSDATRPIAALGEVIIRTWVAGEARLQTERVESRLTGRTRTAVKLRLASWEHPITTCEGFASQRVETEVLPIGGLFAPIGIVRETCRETQSARVEIDEAALKTRLERLALADAALRMTLDAPPIVSVERTWIDYEKTGEGAMRARAVYEITIDAAVTREALLQGG